jgi:4-amino-4-deoxy-L-arabinose transferase-like glycosyltransferase
MANVVRVYMANYRTHAALFVLGFAVFSLPAVLRFYFYGITDIAGFPTYLHVRIAEYIMDGTFNFYDPLSFGGRTYLYPPLFSYALAAFGLLFGLKLGGVAFVSLFGALGIVAFYMTAKRFTSDRYAIASAVMLALIPGTIFLYSHVSTRAVPITIALFALYFVVRDHRKYYRHAAILLGVAALFHPEVPVVFGIIMLLYFLSNKFRMKYLLRIATVTAVIALLWYVPLVLANGFPAANDLHTEYRERRYSLESPGLNNYLWEVEVNNEKKGYLNILVGMFAVMGFAFACINRKDGKYAFLAYWSIFALLMTLAFERLFIYLPFIAAILAVIGLGTFSKERYYRVLIIIFVIYTAFFAAGRINAMATDWPTQQQIDAMTWIKQNTPADSVILSDWQWGHWITGIAERKNFIDGFAEYAPDVNKRLGELNNFYATCEIPQGYGITHICMEDWWIRRNSIDCIFSFQMAYNNSYIYVFSV